MKLFSHKSPSFHLNSLRSYLFPRRYVWLLCALLCVFVVNIFFPDNIYGGMPQDIYLPFQILACFVVFESKKRLLYLLGLIALLLLGARLMHVFFVYDIQNELTLLYICFFGAVFAEVIRQIYSGSLNSIQIVLAGICGLLLIGYCGFYLFLAIEFHQPGSFSNLGAASAVNDLFYFSYITILTVGYGRITPETWIAQNAAVLVALTAYIYSWVVIATIVSEATSRRASPKIRGENDKS